MAHVEQENYQRSIAGLFEFRLAGQAVGNHPNPGFCTLEQLPANLQQIAVESLPFTPELLTVHQNGNLHLPPSICGIGSSITPQLRNQ